MIYEQSYGTHTFLPKLSPFIRNIQNDTARLPSSPSDYRAAEARQEYLAVKIPLLLPSKGKTTAATRREKGEEREEWRDIVD